MTNEKGFVNSFALQITNISRYVTYLQTNANILISYITYKDKSFNLIREVCILNGKQKPVCISFALRYFDISDYFDYTI